DGAHQVRAGAEVVADGRVVALPRRLADLPVGHHAGAVLDEEPFRGVQDHLAGSGTAIRPRRPGHEQHLALPARPPATERSRRRAAWSPRPAVAVAPAPTGVRCTTADLLVDGNGLEPVNRTC